MEIVMQLMPFAGPAVFVAGGVLLIVSVFQVIDQIERRHRPKPRGRRA
jgi:hypothetical protein